MRRCPLKHETVIFFHTGCLCISQDSVSGDHSGREGSVAITDNLYVNWERTFLTELEAQEDLQDGK